MRSKPVEYCDVVMKGGITSGVVYPNAVLALAKRYTFKNIGGTSAGAIAAAALAAAALGERRRSLTPVSVEADDPNLGLSGLRRVAVELQTPGFILSLFQPGAGMRHAFDLLLDFTRTSELVPRAVAAAKAIVLTAPLTTIVTALVLLLTGWVVAGLPGLVLLLLPAILIAFALGAAIALLSLAKRVRENSLGLCSGRGRGAGDRSPAGLTEWLHRVLQGMSGQNDRPLLFQDLWDAPKFPKEPGTRAVSLEMITTSISHHEPRRLPLENSRFWFRRDQFLNLFPQEVVDWMAARDPAPLTIDGILHHRLPEDGQLPVIVATRMSLSFPLLLSAVPLHEAVWKSESAKDRIRSWHSAVSRLRLRSSCGYSCRTT